MANISTTIKSICAVMVMLAVFSMTVLASDSFAPNRTIVDRDQEGDTTLTIYRNHPEDSIPFQVNNLFPGDAETKSYYLAVSYRGTVTVHFHADVRSGYEKLGEVLKCRVVLKNTGDVLYDGLMGDMPESLEHGLLSGDVTTDQLEYEITAYLDTSVGNEYMKRELVADFRWWAVAETEPDDDEPSGGGPGDESSGGDDRPEDDSSGGDVSDDGTPEGSQGDESEDSAKPMEPGKDYDMITDETTETQERFLPGELVNPPKTGDSSRTLLSAIAAIGAALLFILLWRRDRKEDAGHEQ